MTLSIISSMSLSASLYRSYGALYDRFSTRLFTFDELTETIEVGVGSGLKTASLLRSRGYLVVFGRLGRLRQYRLLSPEQSLFAHLHMKNTSELVQQRYLHILVEACAQLRRAEAVGLRGVWLFGSVARGDARTNSDVDLVVVTKDLPGGRKEMSERIYSSLKIEEERQFLYENGIATDLSVYPLSETELGRFYPLMLDVAREGVVLFEVDGILSRASSSMKLAMPRLGVKRRRLGRGWLWVIPPGLEVGELLEVREALRIVS